MRFDLAWLRDELEGAPAADVLAERLTDCGFNVEVREPSGSSEIWDVDVTTNRPDAMSHRGLAREAAVATGATLKALKVEVEESGEPASSLVSVEIEAPELCSRYVARVIRGVRIGPSPLWLQEGLERCGVRPINNVVDATNYVLLRLGQPLHAFDLEKVQGRRIVVRRASEGEVLLTLDGVERRLDPEVLVIADVEKASALAGIMGGADSEIGEGTTDVLLESAWFEPIPIRRAARRLGLHTEASHRFERGADPEMVPVAADVAAALIAGLTGGTVCPGRVDVQPRPWSPASLEFSVAALSAFTGLEIDGDEAVRILDGLGFAPKRRGDVVAVSVPSWRVDVQRVPDLYEEIIRHVGYGNVPAVLPTLPTAPGERHGAWSLIDRARHAAVGAGLAEVVTYAFIGSAEDERVAALPLEMPDPLPLDNPLARTQSTMRRGLLPGLLSAARTNINQGETSLALFEEGRVFGLVGGEPVEREHLGIVLAGRTGGWDNGEKVGFLHLKGVVDEIASRIGFAELLWERGGAPWLDEAQGAVLKDENGAVVGLAGLLSPEMAGAWDLKQPLYVAELDLATAPEGSPVPRFAPLPRFPGIAADMTVEHDRELSYAELVATVRELAEETVQEIGLVARYEGKGLPENAVRTTLRLLYRHAERSLTQDEVNAAQEALRQELSKRLGVVFA